MSLSKLFVVGLASVAQQAFAEDCAASTLASGYNFVGDTNVNCNANTAKLIKHFSPASGAEAIASFGQNRIFKTAAVHTDQKTEASDVDTLCACLQLCLDNIKYASGPDHSEAADCKGIYWDISASSCTWFTGELLTRQFTEANLASQTECTADASAQIFTYVADSPPAYEWDTTKTCADNWPIDDKCPESVDDAPCGCKLNADVWPQTCVQDDDCETAAEGATLGAADADANPWSADVLGMYGGVVAVFIGIVLLTSGKKKGVQESEGDMIASLRLSGGFGDNLDIDEEVRIVKKKKDKKKDKKKKKSKKEDPNEGYDDDLFVL